MLSAILLAMASMIALTTASRNITCTWELLGQSAGQSAPTYFIDISGPFIGEATCNCLRENLVSKDIINSTWGCSPYSNDSTRVIFSGQEGCQPWIDQAFRNSIPEIQDSLRCSNATFPRMRNSTFLLVENGNSTDITLTISTEVMNCTARTNNTKPEIAGEQLMRLAGWKSYMNSSHCPYVENGTMNMAWTIPKEYDTISARSDLRLAFPGYDIVAG